MKDDTAKENQRPLIKHPHCNDDFVSVADKITKKKKKKKEKKNFWKQNCKYYTALVERTMGPFDSVLCFLLYCIVNCYFFKNL